MPTSRNAATATFVAFTVDTVPPVAPTNVGLTAATDLGTSSTDAITKVTGVTVTGTAEAGSTVRVYDTDGTTELGSVTLASGSTTFSVAVTLTQGTHQITATYTSSDNVHSGSSNNTNLTVNKATLTVTPDPQSRTYGQAAPSYTFSVTGFQNGENAGTASGYVAPSCTSDYTVTTTVAQSPRAISCSDTGVRGGCLTRWTSARRAYSLRADSFIYYYFDRFYTL